MKDTEQLEDEIGGLGRGETPDASYEDPPGTI